MDILEMINSLNETNINEVVEAVLSKYKALFPDWEIATFAVFMKEDRNVQLDNMIQLLEKLKTSQ
jgi:hypothetical protein